MISNVKMAALAAATAIAGMAPGISYAEDVNVAFFLQWPTPNLMAKTSGAYSDAMGVEVNWTDFTTGTAMTEAMLAGDIDISYSQGLAPFVTAIQQGAPLKMVGIAVVYEANDCFVRNDLGIDGSPSKEKDVSGTARQDRCRSAEHDGRLCVPQVHGALQHRHLDDDGR